MNRKKRENFDQNKTVIICFDLNNIFKACISLLFFLLLLYSLTFINLFFLSKKNLKIKKRFIKKNQAKFEKTFKKADYYVFFI